MKDTRLHTVWNVGKFSSGMRILNSMSAFHWSEERRLAHSGNVTDAVKISNTNLYLNGTKTRVPNLAITANSMSLTGDSTRKCAQACKFVILLRY